MRSLAVVALVVACGNNAAVMDASFGDDDAVLGDAVPCDPLTLCGGSCVDITADPANCGGCGIACTSVEGCEQSHCVDMVMSCAQVFANNPAAGSGLFYTAGGVPMFCDAANPTLTLSGLYFGRSNVSQGSGYQLVTLAQLQTPIDQSAFIALFDAQAGMKLIEGWTAGSCCIKYSATADGTFLGFGSQSIEPIADNGTVECGGDIADPIYGFALGGTTDEVGTLQPGFFTTLAPQSITSCTDGDNPAFYWRVSL